MNITRLTTEQAVSFAILNCRKMVDYIEYLDYDEIDWLEMLSLSKN